MKVEVLGINETLRFLGKSVTQNVAQVASIYEEEARKATPIKSGRARRNWTKTVNSQGFDVSNNVPYIGRLEEGYSKQAPKGISGAATRRANSRIKSL
tara:strand:+ start:123 stop:416 length:294 start_codon:yes stop_codon:yes gene_type:complete